MNFFPRPARTRSAPPPPPGPAPAQTSTPPESDAPPSAHLQGTFFALSIIFFAAVTLHGWHPSDVARYAAIWTAIAIVVSIGFDLRRGVRNLQRADLFAILSYYFLTLFEFLFPQKNFDKMLSTASASDGTIICLIGFAGLFIGRHLFVPKKQPFRATLTHEIPRGYMIGLFWGAFCIGFSNMLVAVNFDFVAMVNWFMAPRFTQPWGRGKYGDFQALLYELNMVIQLLPPLGGIILARRYRYPAFHLLLIVAALALTFFYGFAGGTRNLLATFLVTFLIGYSLASPRHRTKEVVAVGVTFAIIMCIATFFMLQFRDIGLKNYLQGKGPPRLSQAEEKQSFYVDYNLFSICKLAEFFPTSHAYLGWEIPYQALIRPIPRALWPGKPMGLSMSIEDALNVDGLTLSASFAGEAYMSGGSTAVFFIALAIGGFMGWWGSLSSLQNSEIGHLVYASGFFAAVISMRSLFVLTTALLPAFAAIGFCTLLVAVLVSQTRKLLNRSRPMPRAPMRPPQPVRRA